MDMELGKVAFDAYSRTVGRVTYDGKQIPAWDGLTDIVRAGWAHAASEVVAAAEDQIRERAPQDPPEGT